MNHGVLTKFPNSTTTSKLLLKEVVRVLRHRRVANKKKTIQTTQTDWINAKKVLCRIKRVKKNKKKIASGEITTATTGGEGGRESEREGKTSSGREVLSFAAQKSNMSSSSSSATPSGLPR